MSFDLRATFLAAGAAFGTGATIAAAYAGLPVLAVIGAVGTVADIVAAGITQCSQGVDAASFAAPNDKAGVINPARLKPGDRMEDGTIYAGISPDTGKPMCTTPEDVPVRGPLMYAWAKGYAVEVEAHGYKDWRVPSKGELNVLFNNRAAIGGFDERGWYWSSTEWNANSAAWSRHFRNGDGGYLNPSVRCVRG